MPVTSSRPGPYAPGSAVLSIVSRYRDGRVPPPISAETLARAGVSESLIPRTLQALQTLDLINTDGQPTQILEDLRLAPEAEYRDRLADWLRAAYAEVFAFVDPTKDDATRIRDAFRGYQPHGQQDRMVTLFQQLCAAAGLIPEKPATSSRPAGGPNGGAVVRPRGAASTTAPRVAPKPPLKPVHSKSSTGLPPALAGLLDSLPVNGSGWTAADRQRFLTAFQAVLDLCYPIEEPEDDQTAA